MSVQISSLNLRAATGRLTELDWTKRIYLFLQQRFPETQLRLGRERQIWDRSRVDILTDLLAIEVDWAKKWPEAIGQAEWYSLNFGRPPGICLLVSDYVDEAKYVYRAQACCARRNMPLWLVDTAKNTITIDGDTYDLPVI